MSTSLLLLVLLAACAAQNITISPGWTVTQQQLDAWSKSLLKTEKEMRLYHWGPMTAGVRWADRGFVDQGELDVLTRSDRGIFLSKDRSAQKSQGFYCTVFVLPAGTLIYNSADLSVLGRRYISFSERAQLGRVVPFLHHYLTNRWVTYSAKLTSNVQSGLRETPPVLPSRFAVTEQQLWKWNDEFLSMSANGSISSNLNTSINYLNRFLTLFYYFDAIALSRAIRVSPQDPWRQFEPEHFESYQNARHYLQQVLLGREKMGVSRRGILGAGFPKAQWVQNQTDVVIPKLWSMIAGTKQKTVTMRGGEVRAGGSNLPNNTFAVPEGELAAMMANPYLTVQVYSYGKNSEVCYYYPDVNHYQGVAKAGYLSAELVDILNNLDKNATKNNQTLQAQMNRRILSELLNNLFSRWYGKNITSIRELTKLMIEFVSIHPYEDYNGRTTRIYAHLAIYESAVGEYSKVQLPHEYISDFDTITPTRIYGQFTENASPYIWQLMRSLQKEMILSAGLGKQPDYFVLPQWEDLTRSLKMFGLNGTVTWSSDDLYMIEKRRFTQLLDKIIGPDWGKTLQTK